MENRRLSQACETASSPLPLYYPGVAYVKARVGTTFMGRIRGDKQPGDSLVVVTVPIELASPG